MKGDLIDDLLAGQLKADEIVRRAGFLGADLSAGSLGIVVDIDGFGGLIKEQMLDEKAIQRVKRELLSSVSWAIRTNCKKSLISLKSDDVIVFLTPAVAGQVESREFAGEAERLAKEVSKTFSSRLQGYTVSIGLGRFYVDPAGMAKTFEEAKTALNISRKLGKVDSVTRFDDVGTYKLLLRAYDQDADELTLLYAETVAPLVAYDAKHKSDLIKSLECYFKNNRNLNATAEELFAHRHTVRYRLERISEITSLNVDVSEELERLSLGLKAMRLLSSLNPGSIR
jgi:purine catabolism regulator